MGLLAAGPPSDIGNSHEQILLQDIHAGMTAEMITKVIRSDISDAGKVKAISLASEVTNEHFSDAFDRDNSLVIFEALISKIPMINESALSSALRNHNSLVFVAMLTSGKTILSKEWVFEKAGTLNDDQWEALSRAHPQLRFTLDQGSVEEIKAMGLRFPGIYRREAVCQRVAEDFVKINQIRQVENLTREFDWECLIRTTGDEYPLLRAKIIQAIENRIGWEDKSS